MYTICKNSSPPFSKQKMQREKTIQTNHQKTTKNIKSENWPKKGPPSPTPKPAPSFRLRCEEISQGRSSSSDSEDEEHAKGVGFLRSERQQIIILVVVLFVIFNIFFFLFDSFWFFLGLLPIILTFSRLLLGKSKLLFWGWLVELLGCTLGPGFRLMTLNRKPVGGFYSLWFPARVCSRSSVLKIKFPDPNPPFERHECPLLHHSISNWVILQL